MRNLTGLFGCLASIIVTVSACTEDPLKPDIGKNDTPEEIILGVEKVYTVDSVEVRSADYRIMFRNPTPITLKKEYPQGIAEVFLLKSDVKEFKDDRREVSITFTDGKSALLSYDSWLDAQIDRTLVSFDEQKSPETVQFVIRDSKPDSVRVDISGCDGLVDFEIRYNEDGKGGSIIFTPKTDSYFTKDIDVALSNGSKIISWKVSLVRENFKFADGTVEKSYAFLEYERYFEIEMSKADKSVIVVIPDECSGWIKARMSNENVNGVDQTTVCILLSENSGNTSRKARILVRKDGYERELTIDVSQIGSGMEGALKHALLNFYESLNGAAWECSENWGTDKPLFEWYGINACDKVNKEPFGEQGYAYFGTDDRWILDITANNMRGEIPMEFWKACKYFEAIRISREYLPTSTVPDCIWHKGLYSLDFSYSFMNVPLSSAIGNASNLHELSLQSCNVTGGIPDALTTITHLEYLNMRECGLTGALPSAIGNLKELKTCLLDINPDLGGTLPDSFYDLESLVDFNIFATRIGGKLSSRIINLHRLQSFYISGCEFEGTIPEEFGQLDNIIGYEFDGNYFTEIPQFVRYIGFNCRRNGKTTSSGDWVGSAGFPLGVPYPQRTKADGRPDNYIVTVPDILEFPEILVDGKPLKRPGYYIDYKLGHQLPFPLWAKVKYGIYCWEKGHIDEMKYPVFPVADDLQYPANEYYYDGKDWRHPKLQYPAREYYHDGSGWVHDASCPWEKEYIEPGN